MDCDRSTQLGEVVIHQADPAPRTSRALPIAITILSILLWAALVAITQAFVVFSQPVTGEGTEYLLIFLVKYYPLVALGALAVGLLLGDARGYVAVTAASLPPLLLGLLVLQMFLSHAVDWDTYQSAEQEAFMRASASGSARDIREQVAAGASPNMAGENGNNPLLAAYRRDNRDTFAALLGAGADPNVLPRDSTQYNIAFALIEDLGDTGKRRKYFELLLEHGLDVNLGDDFGRLIHKAASSDDPQYLPMLIGRGADANAKGPALPPPIAAATMFAHYDKALLLLPHSSTENMEEAAGILEEHNRRHHIIGDRDQREELVRQLKARGIDFDAAFTKFEAERQERLERAFSPAGEQSSVGRPANDA